MPDEKVIKALIRFGLDKDSLAQVRGGSKTVEDALKGIEQQAEKARTNTTKIAAAFDTLDRAGRGVSRLGMSLREFGDALGSPALTQLGQLTSGVGQLANSVSDLYDTAKSLKGLGGLSKIIGVGGAALGGAAIGASIYDATIGKAQGTNTGTILGQGASLFSRAVVTLTQGADAGNKAFLDTARMYGLVKSAADEYNDQLSRQKQAYGSLALYLLDLEKQLTQASQATRQRGLFGALSGSITGAAGQLLGAAGTAAAQKDPVLQTYIAYRREANVAEKQYGVERNKIIATAWQDQLRTIATYQTNEKTLRAQFEQQELASRVAFLRNESKLLEEENRQREKSLAVYQAQRARAAAQFERSEQRTEDDYRRNRAKSAVDFARSEAETEAQYYAQRAENAKHFGVETARLEEDHRRQMRRLAEDFDDSLEGLQESRDALGIIRAQREHEKERRRAEEDYQVQVQRRDADYAAELADREAAFAAQREQRQADFTVRLSEQDAEFVRQREQRKADFEQTRKEQQADFDAQAKERQAEFERQAQQRQADYDEQARERQRQYALAAAERLQTMSEELKHLQTERDARLGELDTQFKAEKDKRDQDFKDRLSELGVNLGKETDTRNAYYRQMASDLEAWLSGLRAKTAALPGAGAVANPAAMVNTVGGAAQNAINQIVTGIQGFQTGGYARGLARLGERGVPEFVLSDRTTRAAERMAGGALSQDSVLALMAGQAAGSNVPGRPSTLSVQQNFTFVGALSESEKEWFKREAFQQAVNAFDQVIG